MSRTLGGDPAEGRRVLLILGLIPPYYRAPFARPRCAFRLV